MSSAPNIVNLPGWPTRILIDGHLVSGEGEPIRVINPSSGGLTTEFPGASLDQFGQAITAARRAFDSGIWAGKRPDERVAILRQFHALLAERVGELKDLVITETGVPVNSPSLAFQVDAPLGQVPPMLDLYLRLPDIEENPLTLEERVSPLGGLLQSIRRYVPVGVVAAISAYNFPVYIGLWKIFPALAAGNSVILRPSPLTPLSTLWIGKIAAEAGLPDGVLNILAEAGSQGAELMTTDEAVDLVTFTGSSGVGKKVAQQAAATLKRVHLELGGKSAQIYLPDRVDQAGQAALGVCISHAGQGCVLGTRVFVPEADKPKVLEAMKASLQTLKIGDSRDEQTLLGPVISEAQVQRCENYVRLAVEAGATVVTGGKRVDRPGFYFEPTVLDVADNGNPAARDEIFGPVICVIGYRDIDHAIAMANDTRFGLSGYVHGKDARQALAVARQMRTGTINVNAFLNSANASSGGHKESGLGRERGIEGIRAFQEIQCMNLGTAS